MKTTILALTCLIIAETSAYSVIFKNNSDKPASVTITGKRMDKGFRLGVNGETPDKIDMSNDTEVYWISNKKTPCPPLRPNIQEIILENSGCTFR